MRTADHRREIHDRLRAEAVRRALSGEIDALSEAIFRNTEATSEVVQGVVGLLSDLKLRFERNRERIDRSAQGTGESAP